MCLLFLVFGVWCLFSLRDVVEADWTIPQSVENFEITKPFDKWSLCMWACCAPQIAREILVLMNKNIPLWMMEYVCQKAENHQQEEELEIENLLKQCGYTVDATDTTTELVRLHRVMRKIMIELN